MEKPESINQTPSAREKLLSRARERFPDRTFAELDAAEPQEGAANLDDAIEELLEEYSTRQAESNDKNNKLKKLLINDAVAAEFFQRWMETKDPFSALIETIGDEYGITEEGKEKYQAQLNSYRERRKANDELEAQAQQNWIDSLNSLVTWGESKGLSKEQQLDVIQHLMAIVFNGMENKYSVEDFDLALNAINHDNDVAVARQEGEVAGRNERIAAARRERSASAAMPAFAGSQGGTTHERKPDDENSVWAGLS